MNDFTKEVIKKADELKVRIDKNKNLIIFSKVLKDKNFSQQCSEIFYIQAIINQALQYGNYRRACRYIIIGNSIMDKVEQNKTKIVNNLTKIMVDAT